MLFRPVGHTHSSSHHEVFCSPHTQRTARCQPALGCPACGLNDPRNKWVASGAQGSSWASSPLSATFALAVAQTLDLWRGIDARQERGGKRSFHCPPLVKERTLPAPPRLAPRSAWHDTHLSRRCPARCNPLLHDTLPHSGLRPRPVFSSAVAPNPTKPGPLEVQEVAHHISLRLVRADSPGPDSPASGSWPCACLCLCLFLFLRCHGGRSPESQRPHQCRH
ncbi:hypothetical protein QBC34DRAFT_190162 [Podospora aff. communis PSN243]|uniref:Uncharacterized protein n=1 Tax=Podospora aff. communis PSN243 TaxID=3040156 RepID=A0AAV9GZ57_9PEZI|nr:hypothetical protein QBC34DRAFT_190162 [Podospora aff. communis PSN243]